MGHATGRHFSTFHVLVASLAMVGCSSGADLATDPAAALPEAPQPASPTAPGSVPKIDLGARAKAQVAGKIPLFVAGDVDGNLVLDARDVEALEKIVATPGLATPCGILGDLDADGTLTRADVTRLKAQVEFTKASHRAEILGRTKIGACPAVLPFTTVLAARPGETIEVSALTDARPIAPTPADAAKNPDALTVAIGSGPARLVATTVHEARVAVLDDAAFVWSGYEDTDARAVVLEVGMGGMQYTLPVRVGHAKGVLAANPEGYEKEPPVLGEDLYASGERSEREAGTQSTACNRTALRGTSFVVNLLADWKYDDADAQKEQDDQLMKMHAALVRPEIENDFFHYEGYNDPHLYPRPSRLVTLAPTNAALGVQTQDSDTLAIGDVTTITVETPSGPVTTTATVTAEAKTIAQMTADLTLWKGDQDKVKASVEALFVSFEQKLAAGRSWAFFYVGSHGSPPDPGVIPEPERYGYWSTGLGWRIWWNRAEYLERARAKAAAGGTCYFTAFDDSCNSGYTARYGRDHAAACGLRPATAMFDGALPTQANRWFGVSTESRLAQLDECVAREQEMVDAIGTSIQKGYPKEWLWYLKPTNFGQTYLDRGRHAAECVGK